VGVEGIRHPLSARVDEGVLDIGVTREREGAGPESGGELPEGEGLAAPVLEVSMEGDGFTAAPHEGGGV
jgi:hypothetical protein